MNGRLAMELLTMEFEELRTYTQNTYKTLAEVPENIRKLFAKFRSYPVKITYQYEDGPISFYRFLDPVRPGK